MAVEGGAAESDEEAERAAAEAIVRVKRSHGHAQPYGNLGKLGLDV
jgi:hypothetical protein